MDQEKARKAAELVAEQNYISNRMKDFMVDLKKAGEDYYSTTTVVIYSRWIPALIEKAADELGEIDKQIKEL